MAKRLKFFNGKWIMTEEGENPELLVESDPVPVPLEEEYGSRLYLKAFNFNPAERPMYPYNIISKRGIRTLDFAPVTILYGGNGCGKSTLLNIIADKIGISHKVQGNTNEYMNGYVKNCDFETAEHVKGIPKESTFLRSEEILEQVMVLRKNYAKGKKAVYNNPKEDEYNGVPWNELVRRMLEDPDAITDDERFYISRHSFYKDAQIARDVADSQWSNGETARRMIEETLIQDSLYLLDEPETSLSPEFQREVADLISLYARKLHTQFIIATHSPFFLSIDGARIYDLDRYPTQVCQWQQLKNMQTYFALFNDNRDKFINQK